MLKSDALSQLKKLKSDIKASRNLAIGTVKGTGQKFGFITLEESGKDIYLPPDEMQRVLPGDRVEVEIKKDAKNKNFAALERLIKSNTKEFCGKYVEKGSAHFIEPDLAGMSRWIFVPPNKRLKAKAKDFVQCKMTQHPFKSGKAQASVIKILGSEQDQGIEWRYAKAKNGIIEEWSDEALQEAKGITQDKIDTLASDRKNLSDLPFITIDAATTSDMDDALWIQTADNGWILQVAVADPAALIPEGSKLEQEILQRGTSTYFPGECVAMMPSNLSSDLCSLVEGQPRLAKVVTLSVSSSGEITDTEMEEAVIKSHHKLSYQSVSQFLNDESHDMEITSEAETALKELHKCSEALNNWRKANALTHADRREFYLELNEQKKLVAIREKTQTIAHKIVEECMVATNRSVANYLAKSCEQSLFISHPGIRSDRIETLQKLLNQYKPEEKYALNKLEDFSNCMRQLEQDKDGKSMHTLISRQLEKSSPCSQPMPHFGMGLDCYTTITSPIRKANDYLIHRQLSELLNSREATAVSKEQIGFLEESWQRSRGAVQDVEQWLKCQFMQNQKGPFEASVLRVFTSGFQVKLLENGIEGFVSTKEMEGKISFHQDVMKLSGKNLNISLDQQVSVSLKHIDWTRKQIQFELIKETATVEQTEAETSGA